MKLSDEQLISLAKSQNQNNEVQKGRKYESYLRLFTESKFEDDIKKESAWKDFRGFMKKALSEEKDIRISEFIQYPLSVVGISKSLMNDLYKVFDAGNSYFNIDTVKKRGGEELQDLFSEINLDNWIEENGKEVLRNKPNSIVVVDRDENGKPYVILVDNERLLDFQMKDNNYSFEYISFLHSETKNESGKLERRISIYDDEKYVVVLEVEGNYTIESLNNHEIGYCPARMFLSKRLNSNSELNRESPLSLVLSKLKEWQYFDTYKFYTDHYAPFPVTEMMREDCGVDSCQNGYIMEVSEYFDGGERKERTIQRECKACKSLNQVGVGAKILLDPVDEDEKSASGKFRMISNDTANLTYISEKLKEIETYIKLKVVGIDNIQSKEAINEKQVQGSFESRTNVLLDIKSNLDDLYVWIAETISKALNKKQISVTANFGTEWYLVSEEDLQDRFEKAKKAGLPKEEINMIYHQLIETKYKGNPDKIDRLKVLNAIDPLPYLNTKEKKELYDLNLITDNEYLISQRLHIFVQRFESENGSIVFWGSELDFREKIIKLVSILNKYSDEYKRENDYAKQIGGGEKTDE